MGEEEWGEVDSYLEGVLLPGDEALTGALESSEAGGLPPISVSPLQGRLLQLLARSVGARRILEIGTLGGYSTTWLARALPEGGRLVTLELDPHHAEVAAANLARAGVRDRVEIRLGRALETLPRLVDEEEPFDLVFIDADKPSNAEYFSFALRLSHPGTLIVVDNVIRQGTVADGASSEPSVVGTRRLFEAIAAEPRVEATAIQTVGAKGHDGLCLALVR